MKIRGIIFDVYGTLIDIHTDEGAGDLYRVIGHFLGYQGIHVNPHQLREDYFKIMEEQRRAGGEKHPEFDAVAVWRMLIERQPGASPALSEGKRKVLPCFLAEFFRSLSLHRLQLYPGVKPGLDALRSRFRLAALSDAQSAWALPEMRTVGIDSYFNPIIVSGDYGFRKPDRRLFEKALSGLRLSSPRVVFVGNDMYRDIHGAKRLGIKTVFFSSNQGQKEMAGVEPDYIIHQFAELPQAIAFLERQ